MAEDINGPTRTAQSVVRRSRRISLVWLIPVVALAVAGWMVYSALLDRGPVVIIEFQRAEGLEAGKTLIKYRDISIGTVQSVSLSDDLSRIEVRAEMDKGTEDLLAEDSQFWIVRPRIGVGGVSGLSTLVSGAHIEIDPGEGARQTRFVGLEEPPPISSDVPGRRFVLKAPTLGSVGRGAPIYFRGIEVGQILSSDLDIAQNEVITHAFVRSPYDELVSSTTRFWNVSGITARFGTAGFELGIESVQSLLVGGVAFAVPPWTLSGESAPDGAAFTLYENRFQAFENKPDFDRRFVVNFETSLSGLRAGSPVEIRGIRVGEVTSVQLAANADRSAIVIQAIVDTNLDTPVIDMNTGEAIEDIAIEDLVKRGLRARLAAGNLLTGELKVEVDFFPDAPPADLQYVNDLPVLPSVPAQIDSLTASVDGILKQIASLDLAGLVNDLRGTAEAFGELANDPALRSALASIDATAASIEGVARLLEREAGPLAADFGASAQGMTATLRDAQATLRSIERTAGPDSALIFDLRRLLDELTGASRSIRSFADYLDRHPEALIRGRQGTYR